MAGCGTSFLFFITTFTSTVYAGIIYQLVAMLDNKECYYWFQQDDAVCHTSNETVEMLHEFFHSQLIKRKKKICGLHAHLRPPDIFSMELSERHSVPQIQSQTGRAV